MENLPASLPAGLALGPSLFLAFLFGMVGVGYFMYGKNEKKGLFMIAGVVLGVYPFFISNAVMIVVVGVLLMALPVYFKG